ncbi:hypothetical protein TruAng_008990 [Truncatella angustata]|nr:hypothetical protein TruAng_008990 [Truncatella angustata]
MDAARARTQAQIEGQHIVASILIAIVIAKLVLLLIETKEKTRILLPEFSETSSELRSSLFTRAFFIWLIPVLSAGFKGVISSEDLPSINEKLSSEALTGKVESRWKKDVPKGSYALMFDVLLSFPKEFSIVLISNAIQVGLQICQPTLTQELVTFLESPTTPMNVGYGLLGGFFCISILNALLVPWGFHFSNRLMIKARGALVPMIYSKLMQCSGSDVNRSTAFTLMTTDVEKIVDTWWRLLDPWTCLLKISIGTYLLYRQLGAVCCVPIIVIFSYAPQILGPLITFGAYSIMRMVSHQTKFPVATAVTCLSILNLISTPAMQLLLAIPMGAQSVGSFARIQAFLQLSETPVLTTTTTSSSNDTNVIMTREKSAERDETYATQHHPEQPCGQDAKGSGPVPILSPNLYFTPNSFTAITGPIGCGKSTVLKGLLSSDEGQESCALPSRDIAYCSQTPWIYEGTIRDNIIGQSEMDDPWYQSVIQGCELDVDIGQAPEGDAAAVGSRGSKLSGGQRQRIAIARALYSKKPRVIFDDVTSALDGHTLSAVADKIFGRTGILRSKGTSVVLATHAVQILQLADKVLLMGKNGEIIDSGTYDQLSKRHQSFVQRQVSDSPKQLSDSETSDAGTRLESSVGEYQTRLQTRVADLRRQKGDWRSYGFYIGSMGWLNFLIFVLSAIFYVLFNAIFGVWLTWWAEDTTDSHSLGYWLGLYATWAALIALGLLFTPIFFFTKLASKASKTMHTELLVTAMRAPMSTISSTEDMGSLVNRFSQDIRLCDWQLPFNILLTLFVSLFLDTIQGITTIHAFGWSQAYMQKNLSLLDSSQKPYYLLFCVQRWLILVLALMVTGIEAVVIGLAIALRTKVSAGLVGLAVVQVTSLTKGLSDLVMQWTEMETSLGAVSRTYRFSHDTPREDHFGEGTTTLPVEWPSGGSITFEGVSATYDLALSNITFAVKSGRILIDGVVISNMDPEMIRSKLNCVTQEPFLLDETIRENLGPWGAQVPDDKMIQALKQVDLWSKVESLGGLNARLEGDLLSHGQRQLFCLARALLRKSSVLILDEPTGHIDPATDATIQRLIREGFPGRTIIMIAHRLQSLVEFDTVMVLDKGRLIEIGEPKTLLSDSASSFSALFRAGGSES